MKHCFTLSHLKVSIDGKVIIKNVSLQIKPGEVHALMGPNGSGKSSTAMALAGHPGYQVEEKKDTSILMNGEDLLEMSPDERSQAGLFLAFQYPVEVPGVKVISFLRQAHNARFADQQKKLFKKALDFQKHLYALADELKISRDLLSRGLNEGFSGGEKKQLEILQMAVLEPKYAILDETDSGLDIDAIKKVAFGVKKIIEKYNTGVLVITHYKRILEYLQPDFVHVMVKGEIAESGGPEIVDRLEAEGYGG